MTISTVAILFFPLLMAFAASSDLLTMRISNILVLMIVVAFFIVAMIVQLPFDRIASQLVMAIIVLAVGFAFFAFGWIGGGDAKLAAATALWINLGVLLPFLVYAALLGGALTLGILAIRRWPLPRQLLGVGWIQRLHNPGSGVPYGIALAAAGLLVYPRSELFQLLIA